MQKLVLNTVVVAIELLGHHQAQTVAFLHGLLRDRLLPSTRAFKQPLHGRIITLHPPVCHRLLRLLCVSRRSFECRNTVDP